MLGKTLLLYFARQRRQTGHDYREGQALVDKERSWKCTNRMSSGHFIAHIDSVTDPKTGSA